jgi:nitrite reductase (NADH) large subunit
MAKKRLVVVGNGMAGVRAVEEVLLRGGAKHFNFTVFGDEPYGNYNRIMLSNVLSGEQDASEIFINPLDWYRENEIVLHAGAPVVEVDRAAKIVVSETGVAKHTTSCSLRPEAARSSLRSRESTVTTDD